MSRRLSFITPGALALAGASSFAQAEVWSDIVGVVRGLEEGGTVKFKAS